MFEDHKLNAVLWIRILFIVNCKNHLIEGSKCHLIIKIHSPFKLTEEFAFSFQQDQDPVPYKDVMYQYHNDTEAEH